jgi:hypothetical protein
LVDNVAMLALLRRVGAAVTRVTRELGTYEFELSLVAGDRRDDDLVPLPALAPC